MKRDTFYNDNDRKVCAWLRQLAKDGHISPGTVNETSIAQLTPDDVRGYRRVHFFAGIGGWDYALKLAGWPEDREVWTGSCPCQPYSVAGKGKGNEDERNLWPDFRRLIADRLPATVTGEQVASKAGREWFAGVRADLEALGYAVGCADLCAASVGSPHVRQRLFWVANAECERWKRHQQVQRISFAAETPLAVSRYQAIRHRMEMDRDSVGVLIPNGVPLQLARDCVRGFGNAIVPKVAAEFVMAFMEAERGS